MSQRILNLRIRPARLIVLISQRANLNDFMLAIRFLSQLWGGRYCPILPVDPDKPDELTKFRLSAFRPDFVFAQNLADQNWSQPVYDACQPRKYVRLEPSVAEDIRKDIFHEFIHADRALVAMHEAKSFGTRLIRPLKVVSVPPDSEWAPYCAAYFGLHHPKLREKLRDEEIMFGSTHFPEFVDLVRDFVDGWKQSWIEVGSYRLNSQIPFAQPLVPTIVLVEDVIQDLSLFWNLRMSSDSDSPTWLIPIPSVCALDLVIQEKLRDWLVAFQKYGRRPNYCVVTSTSVSEQKCCQFVESFATTLKTTAIEHVDYHTRPNQLPNILAYEHSTIWPAELVGHRLTFTPPRPKTFQGLGSSESWFVDLLKDVKTGRAVRDVHLPSSSVVPDLLNGPCPPNVLFCGIPVFGDGVDSINVRCNPGQTVVDFQIPSADEVLQEILFEAGLKPVHDEKRSSYVPTIKRFGGLHAAARAFTGQPGKILGLLSGTGESRPSVSEADPEANRKLLRMPTLRPNAIKQKCQLGGKQLSGDGYLENVAQMMNSESDRQKRIAISRFKKFSRRERPEDMTLEALLEHWADQSILVRRWHLGCSHCHQSRFVDRLNIQKPIQCPNCGNRIQLRESVDVGYALEHAVGRSLQEGIVTVALTGRFLHNMTNRGFLWLPGVKYQDDSGTGDIDLLACCDGYIVMAECKSLGKTSPDDAVWKTIAEQFSKTVAVAKRCNGHLVVFASQTAEYPRHFKQQLEATAGEIRVLLLDNNDLETGLRSGEGPPLQIGSLFRPEFPDPAVKRTTSGQRQIDFGWCQFMSGE